MQSWSAVPTLAAAVAACALAGCLTNSSVGSPPEDGIPDIGSPPDTSTVDTGMRADTSTDTGKPPDSAATDSGSPDTGSPPDAGGCVPACAKGFRCGSGVCKVDPIGGWTMTIVDGHVRDIYNLLPSSLPDPYVCLKPAWATSWKCTTAKTDTSFPYWGETLSLDLIGNDLTSGTMQLAFLDEDVSVPETICSGKFILAEATVATYGFRWYCNKIGDASDDWFSGSLTPK